MIVYNEEKHLPFIRANLQLLSQYALNLRVIVIDNASRDNTFDLLNEFKDQIPFELISRKQNNLGAAREQAVLVAQTPWIAFLDADCLINQEVIGLTLSRLGNLPQEVAGFGGPWIPAGLNESLYKDLFRVFSSHFRVPQFECAGSARSVKHIPTAYVVYRRQDLINVGNFNPQHARVGEDLDISYRLLSSHKQLLLMPDLAFKHYLPETLRGWFKKIFIYGQARAQSALRYQDILAFNYLLPGLFFIFLLSNLFFWRTLYGWPLVIYFVCAGFLCLKTVPMSRWIKVWVYLVFTHFAYSLGMAIGILSFTFLRYYKRKQAEPMRYKPTSLEEI